MTTQPPIEFDAARYIAELNAAHPNLPCVRCQAQLVDGVCPRVHPEDVAAARRTL